MDDNVPIKFITVLLNYPRAAAYDCHGQYRTYDQQHRYFAFDCFRHLSTYVDTFDNLDVFSNYLPQHHRKPGLLKVAVAG